MSLSASARGNSGGQVTALFDNTMLARIERLRIRSSARFTSRARGEHLAGRSGTSTDFSDYRDYAPGDDTRFVDWNIFSRLHRPYLKQYRQEEEKNVLLLIDGSTSMTLGPKLERACQLAAAFAVMGLLGGEKVSLGFFGQGELTRIGPFRGRAGMSRLFAFLEGVAGGGETPAEEGIEEMLKQHSLGQSGRGVILLFSDFLTFGDLQRAFNLLFASGLEIFAIQILDSTEINPDLASDLRLVDSETGTSLDISVVGNMLAVYQEYRAAYQGKLENLCRQRAGRFITIDAGHDSESVLFGQLLPRGWVS